jgi:hypothetical protein
MMLPPPCFTVGMVPGFLQTWCLAFRQNISILVYQTTESRVSLFIFDFIFI